jgi:hypothetical protein
LPREAQVGLDGGLVVGRGGRGEGGLPEGVVLCRPDDDAAPVCRLDGCVQVVVVIVGDGVGVFAVFGFDEQDAWL